MNKVKVLLFPSGGEGALEIYDSLKYNPRFELYGFSAKKNYTDFLYPEGMYLYTDEKLMITHPEFESTITELLIKYGIDYIIPMIDDVAEKLSKMAPRLSARVVASPYETAVIAADKRLIYNKLAGIVPVPKVFSSNDVTQFPVFVKPAKGYGSNGASIVTEKEDLLRRVNENKELVICEYLPGEEITIDCFTDRHGTLRFVGPRKRERILLGMTFRGRSLPLSEEIRLMAHTINNTLSFRGAWFFQAKRASDGTLKLLEFSVRHPTNSSLYSHMGVNFAAVSLFDAMDMDVEIICNDFELRQERRMKAAYKANIVFTTVYIDFDDTLTVNDKVNSRMMQLVYHFINRGKRVILISSHETGNLYEDMKHLRISESLFDDVIWIKDGTPKYEYITEPKSVFIDNCFKIRAEVKEKCGIPVFDVNAADCLFDHSKF